MKMHNTMFLLLGVIGLLLVGVAQALIRNSVQEESRSAGSFSRSNMGGWATGGPLERMFGSERGTIRRTDSTQRALGIVLGLLAHILVAVGAGSYAVGKGRSPWFGLLGLLTPIGLLFLAVLEDRGVRGRAMAG